MLKIKKWGKKLLAVSLVVAVFAATGCGSKDDAKSSSDTTPEATKAAAADSGSDVEESSGELVTINVYRDSFNLPQSNADEVKKVQDAINAYIGDKINVNIALTDVGSGEYTDKANLAIAGGEVDLFFTANWMQTIPTDELVKQNAVYDITDLLKDSDLYKSLPDWVWEASKFDGRNYFVPCYKESAEGYDLMFRKDLVDKYSWDLTTVKTLKDIEPMLADCVKEGLKYPYLTQKTAMFQRYYLDKFDFFSGAAESAFLAVDKTQDKVVNTVLTPEFKEFATLMGDWAQKGYLSEDDLTKTTTDTTTQSKDWGISWWTDVPNNAEANSRYKQDVVMAKITKNYVQSNTTLGSAYGISKTASEEKAAACIKFLGILYTDKTVADLLTYGIEGTDYTREADGSVKKIDAKLYDHSSWETGPVTVISLVSGEPADKVELYKTFNDSSEQSIAAGFRFKSASIDADYAACKQVFNEFGFALQNGGYAPADVDQAIADYQKALDDAGFQGIMKEAETQYEAWKATR